MGPRVLSEPRNSAESQGVTWKDTLLLSVPTEVPTLTGPVVALAGTSAVISVSEITVNLADLPLKLTAVVPVRLFPRITTLDPTLLLVGSVSTKGARPVETLKTVPTCGREGPPCRVVP